MSIGIDKLKKIGVQKIHENTHISRAHIEAIFQENFEDMHNKVQLNGFLSILEREYGVDLSDLKSKANEHFEHVAKYTHIQTSTTNLFLVDNRKKKTTFFYIALGIVIFILFAYLNTNITKDEPAISEESSKVAVALVEENATITDENSSLIEHNQTNIEEIEEVLIKNTQETQEKVQEVPKEEIKEVIREVPQKKASLDSGVKSTLLKITPKSKVWIGYINLNTGEKSQTVSLDKLSLDASKDWLLTFGHGHLDIEVNGKLHQYQTAKNLKFIYKDGELKELSFDEFKELNSGKLW